MTETRIIEVTIFEAQMLQMDMNAHVRQMGLHVPAPQGIPQTYSCAMREDFHNRLTAAFNVPAEQPKARAKAKAKPKSPTTQKKPPKGNSNGAAETVNG